MDKEQKLSEQELAELLTELEKVLDSKDAIDRKVEKFREALTSEYADKKVFAIGLNDEYMNRVDNVSEKFDASREDTMLVIFKMGLELLEGRIFV